MGGFGKADRLTPGVSRTTNAQLGLLGRGEGLSLHFAESRSRPWEVWSKGELLKEAGSGEKLLAGVGVRNRKKGRKVCVGR